MKGTLYTSKMTTIYLFALVFISFTTFTTLEVNPSDYGGHYSISAGMTRQFIVSKYFENSTASSNIHFSFQLQNGTQLDYNMIPNIKFLIFVVNQTQTTNNSDSYFINENITLPNLGTFTSRPQNLTYPIINPSFNSGSNAYSYYSNLFKNLNYSIKLVSNDIVINNTYGSNLNFITSNVFKINWKTGWLDSSEVTNYSNKTVTFDYEIEEVNNQTPSLSYSNNYLFDLITLVSVTIGVVTLLFIGTSFRDYSKVSHSKNNTQSFYAYLKAKINMKKGKTTSKQTIQLDKALKKIEEIMDENK